MTDLQPIEITNLDRYGSPPLDWSRPLALLKDPPKEPPYIPFYLSTVGPNNRPHTAGIGALWHDGCLYFTSGPGTRKSRNLATNPACTIAASLTGIDMVFEGEANRFTDSATLEEIAALYRTGGWPTEVADDAFTAPFSAPSAGPPPWYVYRFTIHTAFGVGTAEPNGATRWQFAT